MSLLEKIEAEMKEALKAGDTVRSDTLKMLKTDITYEKAKTGETVSDEKILEVIARAAKKRKEAMTEYRKANREDLASREAQELALIEAYLPEQMAEEDIIKYVTDLVASMGGVSKKDFGRVMGQAMKDLKGKADGVLVKKIITESLGE